MTTVLTTNTTTGDTNDINVILGNMKKVVKGRRNMAGGPPAISISINEKKYPNNRVEYRLALYVNQGLLHSLSDPLQRSVDLFVEIYENEENLFLRFTDNPTEYKVSQRKGFGGLAQIVCTGFTNEFFRKTSKGNRPQFAKVAADSYLVSLAGL